MHCVTNIKKGDCTKYDLTFDVQHKFLWNRHDDFTNCVIALSWNLKKNFWWFCRYFFQLIELCGPFGTRCVHRKWSLFRPRSTKFPRLKIPDFWSTLVAFTTHLEIVQIESIFKKKVFRYEKRVFALIDVITALCLTTQGLCDLW